MHAAQEALSLGEASCPRSRLPSPAVRSEDAHRGTATPFSPAPPGAAAEAESSLPRRSEAAPSPEGLLEENCALLRAAAPGNSKRRRKPFERECSPPEVPPPRSSPVYSRPPDAAVALAAPMEVVASAAAAATLVLQQQQQQQQQRFAEKCSFPSAAIPSAAFPSAAIPSAAPPCSSTSKAASAGGKGCALFPHVWLVCEEKTQAVAVAAVLRRYLELSVEPLQQEEPQEEVRFLSSSKEVCCILQEPITLRQRQQLVGCLRKKVVAVFTPSAFAAVAAAAEAERSRQQQQDLQRDLQQFEALKRQPLESEKLHASMAAGKKSMFQQQQQQQLKIMDSCSLLVLLEAPKLLRDRAVAAAVEAFRSTNNSSSSTDTNNSSTSDTNSNQNTNSSTKCMVCCSSFLPSSVEELHQWQSAVHASTIVFPAAPQNPLPPTTVFADTDKWQRQRQALQFLQLLLRKRLARCVRHFFLEDGQLWLQLLEQQKHQQLQQQLQQQEQSTGTPAVLRRQAQPLSTHAAAQSAETLQSNTSTKEPACLAGSRSCATGRSRPLSRRCGGSSLDRYKRLVEAFSIALIAATGTLRKQGILRMPPEAQQHVLRCLSVAEAAITKDCIQAARERVHVAEKQRQQWGNVKKASLPLSLVQRSSSSSGQQQILVSECRFAMMLLEGREVLNKEGPVGTLEYLLAHATASSSSSSSSGSSSGSTLAEAMERLWSYREMQELLAAGHAAASTAAARMQQAAGCKKDLYFGLLMEGVLLLLQLFHQHSSCNTANTCSSVSNLSAMQGVEGGVLLLTKSSEEAAAAAAALQHAAGKAAASNFTVELLPPSPTFAASASTCGSATTGSTCSPKRLPAAAARDAVAPLAAACNAAAAKAPTAEEVKAAAASGKSRSLVVSLCTNPTEAPMSAAAAGEVSQLAAMLLHASTSGPSDPADAESSHSTGCLLLSGRRLLPVKCLFTADTREAAAHFAAQQEQQAQQQQEKQEQQEQQEQQQQEQQ
ncbi:uncharacterized protein LOC113146952, partial [Cyclospora cayetanensis]|uniref:Uncharacterized protein LOC113146952 n=1 Tax=Cyclospora cayetanensis TaxID=88456 RepID=A0A6P6RUU3_9EIME